MDKEIWKPIKGYEGLYEVSNQGNVRSLNRVDRLGRFYEGKILNIVEVKKTENYVSCVVGLHKNGRAKNMCVGRLVAEAFIPNPENKPQVDHRDANPKNNIVSNLRWVYPYENSNNPLTKKHQSEAAKKRKHQKRSPDWESPIGKSVVAYKNGKVFNRWPSIAKAALELGLDSGSVSKAAHKIRKTCGGLTWEIE